MMTYYSLTVHTRTLLMSLLFLNASLSLVIFFMELKYKRLLSKIILPLIFIINFFVCIIFATETRCIKFSKDTSEIIKKFCEKLF